MDLLLWGKVRPDMVWREWDRAKEACEWGAKWGFDGFVRMEMDLCVFGFLEFYSFFCLIVARKYTLFILFLQRDRYVRFQQGSRARQYT